MSRFKILFKISGSIAAYKSAYLISKLVQNGFEVQTVTTASALKFIGSATLEGLTGKPVLVDMFEPGQMMNHIQLVKWADLILLAPATANTLNRMAAGIADNLVTALFLAHDRHKPYLIAPAMNTNMFTHPATQQSLQTLQSWGAEVLPTTKGLLACGDLGDGRMLEPDDIYDRILKHVDQQQQTEKDAPSILITSGGTRENIDGIRYITNLSTGQTGAALADHFIRRGYRVTYLHATDAARPQLTCDTQQFTGFRDLDNSLQHLLKNRYSALIHLAAVSDFTPLAAEANGERLSLPSSDKLSFSTGELILHLSENYKIVDRVKQYAAHNPLQVVAFKFATVKNEQERLKNVRHLFKHSEADLIVFNDAKDRIKDIQRQFKLYRRNKQIGQAETAADLAVILEQELKLEKIS